MKKIENNQYEKGKTMFVEITSPYAHKKECKNGYQHNLGNHSPGTKWSEMDFWFLSWAGRNVGKKVGFREFQKIYTGLLMACGFQENYAKSMASLSHLKNGPEYAGIIAIR